MVSRRCAISTSVLVGLRARPRQFGVARRNKTQRLWAIDRALIHNVAFGPPRSAATCCGSRQSIPSSRYPSCAGVIVTAQSAPSRGAVDGQTKRPRSNRLA